MTVPACLAAPLIKCLPDYDSGTVSVTANPQNLVLPDYIAGDESTVLFSLYGGWGQSNESGALYALDAAAAIMVKLQEGGAPIVPAGKTLYAVSSAGVETIVTTFPHQTQATCTVYVELQELFGIATLRATGAGGSNPTTFQTVRARTVFDAAPILAALGANDRYYRIR